MPGAARRAAPEQRSTNTGEGKLRGKTDVLIRQSEQGTGRLPVAGQGQRSLAGGKTQRLHFELLGDTGRNREAGLRQVQAERPLFTQAHSTHPHTYVGNTVSGAKDRAKVLNRLYSESTPNPMTTTVVIGLEASSQQGKGSRPERPGKGKRQKAE